jgi:aconitate hydratase
MPNKTHPNSFAAAATLESGAKKVNYYKLSALEGVNLARLPYSLRILLENLLRCEDGKTVTADDIRFLANWDPKAEPSREIAYMPARVLMQDFTGVPAVVDLAAMRDAMKALGGGQAEIEKINPLVPAELVIDHSVQVDEYGSAYSYDLNAALEFTRNRERYAFLKWGQTAFHYVYEDRGGRQRDGVSGHAGGNGLAHHDDQWAGRAGMGRRRH